jgi:hypothetical protein
MCTPNHNSSFYACFILFTILACIAYYFKRKGVGRVAQNPRYRTYCQGADPQVFSSYGTQGSCPLSQTSDTGYGHMLIQPNSQPLKPISDLTLYDAPTHIKKGRGGPELLGSFLQSLQINANGTLKYSTTASSHFPFNKINHSEPLGKNSDLHKLS